jgi:HD-GYP domain-containing protein (c-di-GMP phosphodiesterase class II)
MHPVYTEQILTRVPAFASFATAAAAHHERLDGRGYPNGIAGSEITPYTRVLAVADVYEALTADRPYRAGMSTEDALSIMRRDAGSHLCGDTLQALEEGLAREVPIAA